MNYRLFFFIGFLWFFMTLLPEKGRSQQNVIDSLKRALVYAEDREKVLLLMEVAEEISDDDTDLAIKYVNEALGLASQHQLDDLKAKCEKYLGELSYDNAQYLKSLLRYRQALLYYQKKELCEEICPILIGMGQVFSRQGSLDSALYYFDNSLEMARIHSDTLWEVVSLRSIGNVYYKKGQLDQALKYFHRGLSLAQLLEDCVHEESKLYNNLGVLMSEWGEYEKSLDYYRNALNIIDSLNDIAEISRIFNNMGTIFWYQGKNDSALSYYLLSLKNREIMGDDNGRAYVLNNLGMYYGSLEDYSNSLRYFMSSLSLFEKVSNRMGIVMSQYNIGSVYQEQKNYQLACKFYNQCLLVAKNQEFNDYVLASLEALKDVYSMMGEWQKAYGSLKEYKSLKDSIQEVQNIALLTEMEVSYEHEKNQADLSILKSKMESAKLEKAQSRILFFGAFFILILLGVSTYLIIWQVRSQADVEHDKLKPALLRYQMNPQFINSSLVGIKELISKKRVKESSLFLIGFAKLIRTFIETSAHSAIVLEREIETTQRFLQLHQLRYDHKLHFELEMDPAIEPEMLAIPPFIFFPVYVYVIDSHLSKGKVDVRLFFHNVERYMMMNLQIQYLCDEKSRIADEQEIMLSFNSVKQRIRLLNKAIREKMVFTYEIDHHAEKQYNELKLQINFPIKPK